MGAPRLCYAHAVSVGAARLASSALVAGAALLVAAACGGGERDAFPTAVPSPTLPAPASERVAFETMDGVRIAASLWPADTPSIVVFAHMRGSDRTAWSSAIERVLHRGFAALAFDFRGHGESADGDADLGKIDLDLEAAVAYARQRGYGRVYVVGASMGGTAALAVASRQDLAGVEPLLFVAATGDQPYRRAVEGDARGGARNQAARPLARERPRHRPAGERPDARGDARRHPVVPGRPLRRAPRSPWTRFAFGPTLRLMNLPEMRALVRRDLRDEDPQQQRWADYVLDRHIERALREFSLAVPRPAVADLTTTPGSRDLSLAPLADRVAVEAVEYPVGLYPASYVRFSLWGDTLTLLVDPASADGVRVYYGRLHALDVTSCSVPAALEDVVAAGAAAYAALEWAQYTVNRVNAGGDDVWRRYLVWGQERLARFHEALARHGRHAGVRARRLYAPAIPPTGPAPLDV